MELKNADKQKGEAQLNERDDKNIPIEAKLENAGADIKDKRTGKIQASPAQQHNASEKMKELGKASDAAWKSGQESGEAWGLEKENDVAEQVKAASDKAVYGLKFRVADAHAKHR
jgi:uncharacterized membrane protein YkoI